MKEKRAKTMREGKKSIPDTLVYMAVERMFSREINRINKEGE